jgi:transcriptional regulator with XRE-family HTH domain
MTPKPPPTPPSPERARLAAALRELRARTDLSLAGLAEKTPFSKSSWERYLNGRTLPPRQAVRELCRLAGEPDGRCLALWEIAESDSSGRATETTRTDTPEPAQAPSPAPAPAPAPAPPAVPHAGHRGVTVVAVLVSVCALAVGGVAAALFLLPRQDGGPRASALPSPSAIGPGCRGAACEGRSPMHMRCGADPATVASHRTASGAWMELRHSEECGASWARMWGTRIGDRIELTVGGGGRGDRGGGPTRTAEVEDDIDAESYVYTPMAATGPGTVVRACFRPAADGRRECFDGRVD